MRQRWDIFCRVVDNYGDIGVCWRLAKQLSADYGLTVRLWLDDLASSRRLLPGLNPGLPQQMVEGVEIRHWQPEFRFDAVAEVVIEAFACELPESYLQAMVDAQPVWLNLEYLSAEAWVDAFHLRPSPHPRLNLSKTFFFPGFSEQSGGLLREPDLIDRRALFQQQPAAQHPLWQGQRLVDGTLKVSLFCYRHAPIHQLLSAMAASSTPVMCMVPESSILDSISAFFGTRPLGIGDSISKDRLTVTVLPFLSQDDYDQLLWSCDLNFVRGEDSWVRAIWAARPLVWLPYQQSDEAHLVKLDAFLARYCDGLDGATAALLESFHLNWAGGRVDAGLWHQLTAELAGLQRHACRWASALGRQPDLAAKLVIFCKKFS